MDKKLVVLADTDEEYLSVLEYKIVEEMGDRAEIEVITQLNYFREYFSQPREIFLLIINEVLYGYEERIQKQNVHYTFLLSEDEENENLPPTRGKCRKICKYSSIREIYRQIEKDTGSAIFSRPSVQTQLLAACSVCGGSGKTLLTLGLCQELADMGKQVLYISCEMLQDYGCYLEEDDRMDPDFAYSMAVQDPRVETDLSRQTGLRGFEYLKPMAKLSLSYQMSGEAYLALVQRLQASRRYDVIVLELPRELDMGDMRILEQADRVLMICQQHRRAGENLKNFLSSIILPEEKYLFVSNRFREDMPDFLEEIPAVGRCSVSSVIPEFESELTLETVREKGLLKAVAYVL